MKKLLALGATVLLSVFIVLIEIDVKNGTSMTCNKPEEELNLGDDTEYYDYNNGEVAALMEQKETIIDWEEKCIRDYCYEWRVVRWMDYVTCVQTRVTKKDVKNI